MSALTVSTVATASDLSDFLDAAEICQAHDPMWVPPLRFLDRERLNPKKNPWFTHGEAALFVARRDGKPVGRISAQIDRAHLELRKDDTGFFGFFESIDDQTVADALFQAATGWLKERRMRRALGPFSLNINDESGLLIDGFNAPPRMGLGHAQPYYGGLVERAGFTKTVDMYAYLTAQDMAVPFRQIKWLKRALARDTRLGVRSVDVKKLDEDIATIVKIWNAGWAENWGSIPLTEADVRHMAATFRLIMIPELVQFATVDGEPVAMCVALPDLNELIRDLKGRMLPFNWMRFAWRVLNRRVYCAGTRVILMGVMPEYKNKPTGSLLALLTVGAVRDASLRLRMPICEMSWVLESNSQTRHSIEEIGGRIYKTYRMYERAI